MNFIKVLILFGCIGIVLPFNAQEQNFTFDHFDVSNGLANNTVLDIFQDTKGFIWFSTDNGASRFDGYDFVNYRKDPKNDNSLVSSRVNSVAEDKNGNLYFATKDGFSVLYEATQTYSNFQNEPENILTLSFNDVRKVVIDKNDKAWVLSFHSLNLFERKKEVFGYFSNVFIRGGEFFDALVDPENNLWLSSNYGVLKYNLNDGKITPYDYAINGNPWVDENMTGWGKKLFRDSKGNIWNATRANGVFKIEPESGKVKRYHYSSKENSIPTNSVTCITEDQQGNIWIGTDGEGIVILNPVTGKLKNIKHDPEYSNGLSNNAIYSLFTDNTGNVWVGTYRGGINVYYPNKYKFKSFKPIRNHKSSLSHNQVLSIFEDKDKNLWVGTDGGGVNMKTPSMKEGEFIRFNAEDKSGSLKSNIIKSFVQLDNGQIWMGTYLKGIQIFDPSTSKFSQLLASGNNSRMNSNSVWSFSKDMQGNVWLGTIAGGLNFYDKRTGEFKYFGWGQDGQLKSNSILVVYTDTNNILWLGTETTGLYRYDKKTDFFHQYSFDNKKSNSLSSNEVRAILMDSQNRLWIGTNGGGLNMLNEDNETFTLYTENDGLPNNIVNDILEDSKGNLWISTGNGLTKFNTESKTFKNYDKSDGLQGNQFTYGTALKTEDGKMYFGGVDGFSVFHPDSISENTLKPKVIFTDFLISNQPVKVNEEDSPLKTSISRTNDITLNHKQSVITFKYTALNFTNAHKNQYAYILEGFDDEWHYVGNRREITYTNLSPGNYTLRIIASNNDGVWNRVGIGLKIKVLPPFWETWWFRLTITLIIGASVIGVYITRLKQIKQRNLELEKQVQERTKDLKMANNELKERQEEILQQNEEIQVQKETVVRQHSDLEAAYQNMSIISEFGQKITSTLNLEDISKMIFDYFSTMMPVDVLGIGIYLQERETLSWNYFRVEDRFLPYFENSLSQGNLLAVWCFNNNKEIFIDDIDKFYAEYNLKGIEIANVTNAKSKIFLPLISEKKSIGVLTIQSFKSGAFDFKRMDAIRSLAIYISLALGNAKAYEKVNNQNKQITSSINYAKNIQKAILPSSAIMSSYFETFTLFRPKDIVSGDFYWFTEVETPHKKYLFYMVVDCTGHGVPGAFMSMIGSRLLNEIIYEAGIYSPKDILSTLDAKIIESLRQEETENNDGMDVCLCRIEKNGSGNHLLTYSGAKRNLLYYQKISNTFTNIKGARSSIGGRRQTKKEFTETKLDFLPGDCIFLSSDGLADQNNIKREKYLQRRLNRLLANNIQKDFQSIKQAIEHDLDRHMQGCEQRDDITFMGIRNNFVPLEN